MDKKLNEFLTSVKDEHEKTLFGYEGIEITFTLDKTNEGATSYNWGRSVLLNQVMDEEDIPGMLEYYLKNLDEIFEAGHLAAQLFVSKFPDPYNRVVDARDYESLSKHAGEYFKDVATKVMRGEEPYLKYISDRELSIEEGDAFPTGIAFQIDISLLVVPGKNTVIISGVKAFAITKPTKVLEYFGDSLKGWLDERKSEEP